MKPLSKFEEKFVKLVFRDGDTVVAKRGSIVDIGEKFIGLQTKENDILVNTEDVVKVQKRREDEG